MEQAAASQARARWTASDLYLDRELSWLEFNARVLAEARNPVHPIWERLKFISIFSSNLDAFFMVRVAGMKRHLRSASQGGIPAALSADPLLARIARFAGELISRQYEYLHSQLLPLVEREGVRLTFWPRYSESQLQFSRRVFQEQIFPCLTPVALEEGREFPFKGNLRQYLGFLLAAPGEQREKIAVLQIPEALERLLQCSEKGEERGYLLLEDVIVHNAEMLFPGYRVVEHLAFRVTRDADLSVDESRDEDYLEAMQEIVLNREHSSPVRLEINGSGSKLEPALQSSLRLEPLEVYRVDGPLDLQLCLELAKWEAAEEGMQGGWLPQAPGDLPDEADIFEALSEGDVLLSHPYESFSPVVRLVQEAARDPAVLAIKITLYRVSGDSLIVQALTDAARRGKQVTALVELKARFDEQKNIGWAQELEQAGAIVLYGVSELKVHAKAFLVIRKEPTGIKRYLHLSTGNYNESTTRQYTDFSLMSSRDELAFDLASFFNTITGYSITPSFRKLAMAPFNLRARLEALIRREIELAKAGGPGLIMFKLNSFVDRPLINLLYEASQQGVRVLLNIRGICCLRPGVEGLSENIRVISIVDHFLEHGRIFYFRNGGQEEVYLSSADLMPRNLDRRIELLFPIEDAGQKKRLRTVLEQTFRANRNAYELAPDGSYVPIQQEAGSEPLRVQEAFQRMAERAAQKRKGESQQAFKVRRKMSALEI